MKKIKIKKILKILFTIDSLPVDKLKCTGYIFGFDFKNEQ
jgi:hypothetical protein